MIIREMSLKDLDTVVDLEKELFSDPWSYKSFLHELTNNQISHYFVLENENSIDEVKLFKNISSKKIFTTIKNIVRSKKSNEMKNEMEIVFEKLQWLIDNSKNVKFFNLLKLQLFKRFPIQYSAFLMMTKKNKENILF